MYYIDKDGRYFTLWLQETIENEIQYHYLEKVQEENYPEGLPKDTNLTGHLLDSKLFSWSLISTHSRSKGKTINSGTLYIDPLEALTIAISKRLSCNCNL